MSSGNFRINWDDGSNCVLNEDSRMYHVVLSVDSTFSIALFSTEVVEAG